MMNYEFCKHESLLQINIIYNIKPSFLQERIDIGKFIIYNSSFIIVFMALIDIIFLLSVLLFAGLGLWRGFLYGLVSFIGTITGIYLASRFYENVAMWLVDHFAWAENASRIVVFVVSFLIINQLVSICFWILKKMSRWFNKVPLIGLANRIAGGAFGIVQAIFVFAFIVFFLERFPLSDKMIESVGGSVFAPYLSAIAGYFWGFVPEGVRAMESFIKYI